VTPPFEPDLARGWTLPARYYTDPAVLARERDRVFARTWQPVGRLELLHRPCDYLTGEIAGEPVVIVRDGGGGLRGFYNVCRHRAGSVAEGCGRRQTLQCSYHGWTYALDGRLVAAPEFEGVCDFDPADFGLKPVRVDAWGPFVFANLDGHAPPLADVLGLIPAETAPFRPAEYTFVERRDYALACNWKAYVDNYLEGYHVPVAHPALFRELDYANYRVETFRFYSKQHAPIRPAQGAAAGRRYGDAAGSQALYYWVFPNWMVNVYPDNLQLNVVIPLAADRTLTVFEWYAPPGADRAAVADSIAFGDQVQREDVALCEAVQRRLGSRAYDRGRFSVARENGVHHFQGLVAEFLGERAATGGSEM
jgi:choline monooxygenase